MSDEFRQLQQQLHLDDQAWAFLQALPEDNRNTLVAAMSAAEHTQRQRVEKALNGAIGFVPAPLRNRARKLLFD